MRSRRGPLGIPRGAAAVEFALVVPVLLLIVLGSIDWGYYFFVQQVVTNAAREAARVGTLTPFDPLNPGADAASQDEAEDAATAYLANAGLAGTPGVTVTSNASVSVTVTYPTGSVTGFLDLVPIMPAQAQAVAVMRR
jgi:Flp pilus assembly protein TadG